jgi:SAM-dependent methyltransferase
MSAVASYPLQRDRAEHERLSDQARFWSADAAALFESAGVGKGWRVADFGSGTLDVALLLAERVGPRGAVHAVDNDGELVRRMASGASTAPGGRLRITEADAYATGWPGGMLDAAHARFLAAPAGRLEDLLAEMRRLVRPGGIVLMQEPDSQSWDVRGAGAAWERMRGLIRAGFALRGGDFDAGRRLLPAMEAAGLENVQRRAVAHTIGGAHPYGMLPLAFARQLRPLWLDEGMATESELDALHDEIAAKLACGARTRTFTLVQAWGRRPAR